jgi:hypothetical protein
MSPAARMHECRTNAARIYAAPIRAVISGTPPRVHEYVHRGYGGFVRAHLVFWGSEPQAGRFARMPGTEAKGCRLMLE